MVFDIHIPTISGQTTVQIKTGSSVIFIGANGSGKTRLATYIENALNLNAHRISAHRALSLNPSVPKISEHHALLGLRLGYTDESLGVQHRNGGRWGSKGPIHLLNDFDFLIQALFAEQANRSLDTHNKVRDGYTGPVEPTKFEVLSTIWESLLPHRKLHITGDNIKTSISGEAEQYPGSEMSDGERAIFYMLGQTLVADKNTLLIFDEPELHVHRSIMAKLWDELEAVRPDCAFLFITHDLEFASSRIADKYILSGFNPRPYWNIEKSPIDTGFDEELTTLILGSRKPILFVEGNNSSLDIAIYRGCYPDWTIIPKGSCEDVIHSVTTMRKNDNLTRITCSGIIDSDDYSQEEKGYLAELGISTLPVSEIENLVLHPRISRIIAQNEGYKGDELDTTLEELSNAIFALLNTDNAIESVVVRYCRRRIDRILKKIDLSGAKKTIELAELYTKETQSLNIEKIADEARTRIHQAINHKDMVLLLENYDNKGMLNLAATHLKRCRVADFENWLVRSMRNNSVPDLIKTFREILPQIEPK